jgi:outer membrane protein assembly factor BamB
MTSQIGLAKFSILLVLLCFPAQSFADATFRGNPAHTGVYDSRSVKEFHQVKWKFHTEGQVISSPAVSSGVVFIGSTDGNLYAVASDYGNLKWKFEAKSRIASSPAVAAGLVYFGAYDGTFYAVDAGTGQMKWKFATQGEHRFSAKHLHGSTPAAETQPDPWDCYLSSPVLWHDTVYFGSGDGNVYALKAATGELTWKFKTGDVVHASPAVADGTVFIGSWDSNFYAIDAASGKGKWQFKTGEDPDTHNQVGIQSSAAVMDGVVYFGCRDSNLYAVDEATGQKRWAFSTKGSWVITSPAVKDGKVYFATSDSGLLYALDAKTGAIIFSLSFLGWPTFSSPAIAGDMLYVGSTAGKLNAIDLSLRKLAWDYATDSSKKNGPAFTKADGTADYYVGFASDFYDDLMAGYAKLLALGPILSSPAVVNGVIYVGSVDGNLYAID